MMITGITIGAFLLVVGVIDYQRAKRLLLDRWRTVEREDWARAMRPAQRMFPFSTVIRSQIVGARTSLWNFSTPEWARRDDLAMRALRRFRTAPFIAATGIMIAGIAIATAA